MFIDTGMASYRALPRITDVSDKGRLTSATLSILCVVGESESGEERRFNIL